MKPHQRMAKHPLLIHLERVHLAPAGKWDPSRRGLCFTIHGPLSLFGRGLVRLDAWQDLLGGFSHICTTVLESLDVLISPNFN